MEEVNPGENVVRIGIFEPATGDNGAGGKQEMLGMQYANKETPTVDIGGTTYNVELVYADNGSTTDKAPTAAAELVSKDVSLVLGSYGSSVAMAGGPVFDEAGLAAIGVTCTNPNITAGNLLGKSLYGLAGGRYGWVGAGGVGAHHYQFPGRYSGGKIRFYPHCGRHGPVSGIPVAVGGDAYGLSFVSTQPRLHQHQGGDL